MQEENHTRARQDMCILPQLKVLWWAELQREGNGSGRGDIPREVREVLSILLQQEPQGQGAHSVHALQLLVLRFTCVVVEGNKPEELHFDCRWGTQYPAGPVTVQIVLFDAERTQPCTKPNIRAALVKVDTTKIWENTCLVLRGHWGLR